MIIFLIAAQFFYAAHAQSTYLKVGEAKEKQPVIAILKPASTAIDLANRIRTIVMNDLSYVGLFSILPDASFPQASLIPGASIDFPAWTKAGTDYVLISSAQEAQGKITFEIHLYQPSGSKELVAKRYLAVSGDWKVMANLAANDIVKAITGTASVFQTRIAMVCDRTRKKEVYTMAFDGTDDQQITRHRSIVVSPAWSPDGKKIAYSVYNRHSDNTKNIDLFEYNFQTKILRLLSNRVGINSGASYSPNGKNLVLTMSFLGNPEIFSLDLASREATRMTSSAGFDVDPIYSPDGSQIAFVSSRSGKPMVYSMSVKNPNAAKRLTFAGQYNASPSYSPDGKKIAFAGWLDGHFDIFIMNSDGTTIERLTKNEGNNEDPFYSPDGRFIVFSSNRSGAKNVYVMDTNGKNVKRLTFGLGACVAPKWSPNLQ